MGFAGRVKWAALLMAVGVLLLPVAAHGASGTIFFGGWYDEPIGSIEFDGSNPHPDLIINRWTIPEAMAVSGDYLYWEANSWPIRIGRAHLDGSEVDNEFLTGGRGHSEVAALSISGGRIYWSETRSSSGLGPDFLSLANLDGSERKLRTLSLGRNAGGPVVVAGRWVFYLIQKDIRGVERYSIARRRLGHKGPRRLVAANRPYVGESLAVLGSHIYWLEEGGHNLFLARSSLNAASINTRFRRIPKQGCAVSGEVVGTAISSEFFFLGCSDGNIDRVSLQGPPSLTTLSTGAELTSGPVLAATP